MSGYGLGLWIIRDEPGVVSDGGAYGAMPWLDVERGYGVMIILEADSSYGGPMMQRTKRVLDNIFDGAD